MTIQNSGIYGAICGLVTGLLLLLDSTGSWKNIKSKFDEIDQFRVLLPSILILTLPFVFAKLFLLGIEGLTGIAPVGTLFLVIIGYRNYRWSQDFSNDKIIADQAKIILERAYGTLTKNGEKVEPVLADRYIWLSTSRLILRYEELRINIKTEVYKAICEAEGDFWKHKFYLLFHDEDLYDIFYFDPNPRNLENLVVDDDCNSQSRLPISPQSALIIFSFFQLKPERDSLDTVNIKNETREYYMPSWPNKYSGLCHLLELYPETFNLYEDYVVENIRTIDAI
ncbi:MAG: hypothetical protein WBA10_13370 [Elainellaceae cyanobacterium]